jgi:hypothetical protein
MQIPHTWKASPTVHRPIPHHQKDWHCGIQDKIAGATVKRAQRLSYVSTTEMPPWTYKMIYEIRRYPCESWTLLPEGPEHKPLNFARSSGAGIPRLKRRGKEKMHLRKNFPTCSKSTSNLEDKIQSKWGRPIRSRLL